MKLQDVKAECCRSKNFNQARESVCMVVSDNLFFIDIPARGSCRNLVHWQEILIQLKMAQDSIINGVRYHIV